MKEAGDYFQLYLSDQDKVNSQEPEEMFGEMFLIPVPLSAVVDLPKLLAMRFPLSPRVW